MNMIKLFEEYRYINFSDPGLLGIRTKKNSTSKDVDEPFFNKPKKEYKDRIAEERRREAEERRAMRRRQDERNREARIQQDAERARQLVRIYAENQERAKEDFQIIHKYIDIVKNEPEKIIKSKYENSGNRYYQFGFLLDDKTRLICGFDMSRNENGMFHVLKINGRQMTNELEKKQNKEQDPFGEETWGSKTPPAETLARMIKDYIIENEIIF